MIAGVAVVEGQQHVMRMLAIQPIPYATRATGFCNQPQLRTKTFFAKRVVWILTVWNRITGERMVHQRYSALFSDGAYLR